ncbi:MAG: hypothetical protein JWO10_1286 [Microbacteriaceae bacterium]|nr:hypothetical protein [Microbacteriaceae bacterium]
MSPAKSTQLMKPATAAQKLGIYLPATPAEFQETPVSREQLNELDATPPEWLAELRKNGPHPRPVIAHKLGISNAGLARSGVDDALTTAEISELLKAPPQWLVKERATQAAVHEENARVKALKAYKRTLADEQGATTRK